VNLFQFKHTIDIASIVKIHTDILEICSLLWPRTFHISPVWLLFLVLEVREPTVRLLAMNIGMPRLVCILVFAQVVIVHIMQFLRQMELVWCWDNVLRRLFISVVVVHPLHEVYRLLVWFLLLISISWVLHLNIDQVIGGEDPRSLMTMVDLWEVYLWFVRSVLHSYAWVISGVNLVHSCWTALLSLRLGPSNNIVTGLQWRSHVISLTTLGEIEWLCNHLICIKRHLWIDVVYRSDLILIIIPVRHRLVFFTLVVPSIVIIALIGLGILHIAFLIIHFLFTISSVLIHILTKILLAYKLDIGIFEVFCRWLVAWVSERLSELIHILNWRFVAILPGLRSYTY
jgi:hypothetical protein